MATVETVERTISANLARDPTFYDPPPPRTMRLAPVTQEATDTKPVAVDPDHGYPYLYTLTGKHPAFSTIYPDEPEGEYNYANPIDAEAKAREIGGVVSLINTYYHVSHPDRRYVGTCRWHEERGLT